MISDILKSKQGVIVVSIILGLGLASLFRQVCKGPHCVVVKGPNPEEINNYFYKVSGECYKYQPNIVDCESKDKQK